MAEALDESAILDFIALSDEAINERKCDVATF